MEKAQTNYRAGNSMLLVSVVACSAFVGLSHLNNLVSKSYNAEKYVRASERDTSRYSSPTNRLCYILVK